MTKADIIKDIQKKTNLSRDLIKLVIDSFMETVKENMSQGENIYLRGFGSFLLKERKEKKARIISKNETIIVPAHYKPVFKPAPEFLKSVKENLTIENN
ncbi:MAG: HU family DNA-binding protein [Bacteroidales bacterium]|jgi:DNA-binding protein HU-beta|nr:integration host factor subunit beta [Bacteroidales bacterium]MDI9575608.1 HU family DNA-binding protein [Bacteroidota bacterium]MDD3755264.1 integration host factor subunit beta [Bacteroidales bacterium]MDY0401300.1 HU family DNA-binding protein [Bacteroidales bacterium]HHW59141.1 integration host factor subunit beta [Bacteroidales bacterium]